jgi:hypothetical protein
MSTIVTLIGPIEYWWNTPEDPNRFLSQPAVEYRAWREILNDFLVREGFLVYRPHEAFKGTWDERAQVLNDVMVEMADYIICMRPPGIPGKGTDHEIEVAAAKKKPVFDAPPGTNLIELVEDIGEIIVFDSIIDKQ